MEYIFRKMSDEDREFYKFTSAKFIEGQSFEEYKKDIKRWLTLSSWHYSSDNAQDLVDRHINLIRDSYIKKESVADVAIDVGYCCG